MLGIAEIHLLPWHAVHHRTDDVRPEQAGQLRAEVTNREVFEECRGPDVKLADDGLLSAAAGHDFLDSTEIASVAVKDVASDEQFEIDHHRVNGILLTRRLRRRSQAKAGVRRASRSRAMSTPASSTLFHGIR